MLVANNVVINRDGIVETRRGSNKMTAGFFNPTYRAKSLFNFGSYLLCHYGTPGSEQYIAYYDSNITSLSGTTTNGSFIVTFSSTATISPGMLISGLASIPANTYVSAVNSATTITITNAATGASTGTVNLTGWRNYAGSYLVPDSSLGRIRSVEANGNFYFTTANGIYKLDSISGTIIAAGGIMALDGQASLTNTVGGFFLPNTQVAYRIVWGYKDSNQNVILGDPSQRIVLANSDLVNSYNVNITFTIPSGITTNYFYQVYRSGMSASATSTASDEMALVIENNPLSSDISAGVLTVLDQTPEQLRNGAALYTSPSQEGILQQNDIPPYAKDVTFFRNCTFYANTKTKQNFFLTMLGVGGSQGVNYLNCLGDISNGSNKIINAGVVNTVATGDTTNALTTVLNLSSLTNISVGNLVFGTNIPTNTFVSFINAASSVACNTVSGSAAVTGITSVSPFYVGQSVTGTGIPANTKISSLVPSSLVLGNTTSGNTTLAVTSGTTTGLVAGQPVSGGSIPSGATVVSTTSTTIVITSAPTATTSTPIAISLGNTIVVSNNATSTNFSTTLVFGSVIGLSNAATGSATGSSLTFFTQTINGLAAGESVSGTGIPANTTVSSIASIVSTTGNITNTSPIITAIPSTAGFIVGQSVIGAGIPQNAKILTVDSGTQITLTANAAATTSGVSLTLGAIVTMSANATATTAGNAIEFYDTITIAGTTYRPAAVENINSNQYQFYSSGTPSQNIDNTAQSLIRVINRTSSNTTVNAFYETGTNDLPGQMLIQERGIGGAIFYITASAHGSAWSPTLPTSGTTVASTNDTFQNAVYYSKVLQPEGVPGTNYFLVGSSDQPILRVLALRQAVFVFKTDGIYRLTGLDPTSFRVDLFDNTAKLVAPDTAVTLNNQIFMLADQGVVSVGDTGVSIISRPIENILLELFSENLSTLSEVGFAVGYETERQYILGVISNATDTYVTQHFVYNTFTNTWVRWPLNRTCGIIDQNDGKLYLGNATSNYVNVERKNRDYTDYVDDIITANLLSVVGNVLTLDSVTGISVGDLMYQAVDTNSLIQSINTQTNQVTVADTVTWTLGAISIYVAIPSEVQYVPFIAKNPGIIKHWREASFFFKDAFFTSLKVGFTSDLSFSVDAVNFAGIQNGLWGTFPWGSAPWGGDGIAFALRTYVPQLKQRCSQLTVDIQHREAYHFFSLNGVSLIYNPIGEKLTR